MNDSTVPIQDLLNAKLDGLDRTINGNHAQVGAWVADLKATIAHTEARWDGHWAESKADRAALHVLVDAQRREMDEVRGALKFMRWALGGGGVVALLGLLKALGAI